jgi:TatD DNase family protein
MRINFHTHSPTLSVGIIELESVYYGQSKLPLANLQSVGLHPWYLEGIDFEVAKQWLSKQIEQPETCAIGESGLDKVCNTPWDLQLSAFKLCADLAESAEKPLIIHCVRAFSEIIALKKEWRPRQSWIFHGFDKNPATAAMLLRAGCFLSFGMALLRKNSSAAESLQATPADRFFLETDDAGESIDLIYETAAKLRGQEIKDLEGQIEMNFAPFIR